MSTFYLATSYLNKVEGAKVRDRLTAAGHKCLFDWMSLEEDDALSFRIVAHAEIIAAQTCDLFIMLAPGRFGTHVELGAALGTCKSVIIIGDVDMDDCIFYHHPLVEFGSVDLALCCLAGFDGVANG